MDFADALRAVNEGKRIRRAVWDSGRESWHGTIVELTHVTVDGTPVPMIVTRHPDGRVVPFSGSQWDILADDWELTGEAGAGDVRPL